MEYDFWSQIDLSLINNLILPTLRFPMPKVSVKLMHLALAQWFRTAV